MRRRSLGGVGVLAEVGVEELAGVEVPPLLRQRNLPLNFVAL
jgi:hypothetical protein